MKKFDELTRLGRIRRARKIVLEGLKEYDIKIDRLDFLEEATNIFFKIKSGNEKYAVKIYQELSSNLDDSLIEAHFLKEVRNKTDIIVPEVVNNRSDEPITVVDTKFAEIPKRIAVYTWMDGTEFDEREKEEHFVQIGKIMAKLHQLSETIEIPDDLKPKKLDKVLYYAGDDYFYKYPKHQKKITKEYSELMDFVIPYLDKQLVKLYDADTILIHGDFNPYNIRLHKDEVRLLDFEDSSAGQPIHDIAILFFYYQFDDNYEVYKKAFLKGYRQIKHLDDLDEEVLDLLMIARRVNFMNYILEINEKPEKYIQLNMERLKNYLKKYNVEY